MHGGTIIARSPGPGLGSEFIIRLPIESSLGPPQRPADVAGPAAAGVRRRILVVDNEISAQSVARVLAIWNHDVQICHDGFSALEQARTFKPEIVLSDISLPRMDGYRLAHELRLLPGLERIRLIAVSGYGQAEDQRRSLEAGFELHLLKPVAPETLAEILSETTV